MPSFGLLSEEARRFELAAEVWRKLHDLAFDLSASEDSEWGDNAERTLKSLSLLFESDSFRDARKWLLPTFGHQLDTTANELRRICAEPWAVEEADGARGWAGKLQTLRLKELKERVKSLLPFFVDAIETSHFMALMRTVGEKNRAQNENRRAKGGEMRQRRAEAARKRAESAELREYLDKRFAETTERAAGAERAALKAKAAAKAILARVEGVPALVAEAQDAMENPEKLAAEMSRFVQSELSDKARNLWSAWKDCGHSVNGAAKKIGMPESSARLLFGKEIVPFYEKHHWPLPKGSGYGKRRRVNMKDGDKDRGAQLDSELYHGHGDPMN